LDAHLFDVKELPPLAPQSTDVIVMWEVIEHVWNVHEYVRTISASLLPGGVFLLSTPNYRQLDYRKKLERGFPSSPPVHLNFFEESSIKKALRTNDYFDRIDIRQEALYRVTYRSLCQEAKGVLRGVDETRMMEHPRCRRLRRSGAYQLRLG
jgi:hypothetical protein